MSSTLHSRHYWRQLGGTVALVVGGVLIIGLLVMIADKVGALGDEARSCDRFVMRGWRRAECRPQRNAPSRPNRADWLR